MRPNTQEVFFPDWDGWVKIKDKKERDIREMNEKFKRKRDECSEAWCRLRSHYWMESARERYTCRAAPEKHLHVHAEPSYAPHLTAKLTEPESKLVYRELHGNTMHKKAQRTFHLSTRRFIQFIPRWHQIPREYFDIQLHLSSSETVFWEDSLGVGTDSCSPLQDQGKKLDLLKTSFYDCCI